MKIVSVKGVIDKNPPLAGGLKTLPHILPKQFKDESALIFLSACPIHYGTIYQSLFTLLGNRPRLCYMFKKVQMFAPVQQQSGDNTDASHNLNPGKIVFWGIL